MWAGDDELALTIRDGVKRYAHADRQGSVISLSDVDRYAVVDFAYSPWGESGAVEPVDFGYTGRRYDPETGLYYFKARCNLLDFAAPTGVLGVPEDMVYWACRLRGAGATKSGMRNAIREAGVHSGNAHTNGPRSSTIVIQQPVERRAS